MMTICAVFLLCFENQVALRRRAPGGLLGGLWEFPNVDGRMTEEKIYAWLEEQKILPEHVVKSACKTHIFTHIEWHMESYLISCKMKSERFMWVTRKELESSVTLPVAFKKFIDCLNI